MQNVDKRNLLRLIKRFWIIFAISLFLPFLLFFLVNSPSFDFTPQASDKQLRIWFEPASIAAAVGESATLNVVADTNNESTAVHSLNLEFKSDPKLTITPLEFTHQNLFSGRVVIGQVEVKSNSSGTFSLEIDKQKVTSSEEDLEIITAPANIVFGL